MDTKQSKSSRPKSFTILFSWPMHVPQIESAVFPGVPVKQIIAAPCASLQTAEQRQVPILWTFRIVLLNRILSFLAGTAALAACSYPFLRLPLPDSAASKWIYGPIPATNKVVTRVSSIRHRILSLLFPRPPRDRICPGIKVHWKPREK